MFTILKIDFFQLWFLYKSGLRFFTTGKYKEIIKIKTIKTKISSALKIKIKVSRVPL